MSIVSKGGGGGALKGEVRIFATGNDIPKGWEAVSLTLPALPADQLFVRAFGAYGGNNQNALVCVASPSGSGYRQHELCLGASNHRARDRDAFSWIQLAPPPVSLITTKRPAALVALPDGRLFACAFGASTATAQAAVYDPSLDAWTWLAAMPAAADGARAVLLSAGPLSGQVLVVSYTGACYAYDPAINVWSTLASAPAHGTVAFGRALLVLPSGNVLSAYGTSWAVFDAQSLTWSAAQTLADGASLSTPALAPTTGGALNLVSSGASDSSWRFCLGYDEATNTWSTSQYRTPFGAALSECPGYDAPDSAARIFHTVSASPERTVFNPGAATPAGNHVYARKL